MPKLLVRPHAPERDGRVIEITPESAGWRHVGFEVFKLHPGQSVSRSTGDREFCLVLVTGKADVVADGQRFSGIGERMSVFDGKAPYSVYVPNGGTWEVTALTELELAVCSAPGHGGRPVRLIAPQDVGYEARGKDANVRHVYNILPETAPADSLLVVEVITPNGNWSSYPPHKHDTDAIPQESSLEETYYHHLNPAQGFAFQRVYTDDRSLDETMAVEDGNVVMVPRGYHPVGAPYGYDLYYLNVMAGPIRQWCFRNDPAHDWIMRKQ
jgi:5-deoxy-glucuronate isomerase